MASQVATLKSPHDLRKNPKLSGQILPYRKVKLSSEGEILVKGKVLFTGYIKQNRVYLPLDKEGWFQTGDLGEFDDQDNLIVKGRRDNMFISGGENIHPEEIEECLLTHPNILQTIVVPFKNDEFGQRPVAFLKKRNKRITSLLEITSYLQKYLPKYKIPDSFFDWPEESRDFKINRWRLQQLLSDPSRKFTLLL
jgi:O-succinylbenzoic acid--CoA ligase